MPRRNRNSGSGLQRSALNSSRVPSSTGRTSQQDTPQLQYSQQASRDASVNGFDDAASTASSDAWVMSEDKHIEIGNEWESLLETALDALDTRRAAAREKSLQSMLCLMAHTYMGDGLEGRHMMLLEALRRSVRSTKSHVEQERALHGISLWFVNFGTQDEAESEFASVSEQLRVMVVDPAGDSQVRAQALGALGVANFIAGADFRDAAELAQFVHTRVLDPALESRDMAVALQAFSTLGLLLTVVADGDSLLLENIFDAAFDSHMRGLRADSVDVRVSAAQNFALVHSALGADSDYAFDSQDELIGMLEMLQHESSKRLGKRDISVQRTAVREVLRTIEDSNAPELKLNLHGRIVRFGDWTRIVRLQAFRRVLGGGLPVHFARNKLLQDVFEVNFDSTSDDFARNRARVVVNPSSKLAKMRTLELHRQRDGR
ncbi:Interferon- developmental regulator 1 [Coemansia sp. RSA 530]|nr:Interferon- developmental regulator 1 [Coemansia sp. RSA 530]KAJ2427091.1 Interferon- developmental regulator 1 [Coemansia sp. RSA 2524]